MKKRQRQNEFQGEEKGAALAEWLNGPRSARRKRVAEIVSTFSEYLAIEERQRMRYGWGGEKALGMHGVGFLHSESDAASKLKASLNSQLRRYRGHLALLTQPSTLGRTRLTLVITAKIADDEREAVATVMALASQGLLLRMRRCQHCTKWFYARFAHARSCSSKCRVAFAQAKPEWKEKYNAWRRKNYAQQKKNGRAHA